MRFEAPKLKPYWVFCEALAQKNRAQRRGKDAAKCLGQDTSITGMAGSASMQDIFLLHIETIARHKAEFIGLLDVRSRLRVNAFQKNTDKLRSLGSALLMRYIAKHRSCGYAENGKPFITNGPFLSLAHSGDYIAAAVSTAAPLGIDIEFAENTSRDFELLAGRLFSPDELVYYHQAPSPLRFYAIWTQKEAAFKMNGTRPMTYNTLSHHEHVFSNVFYETEPYVIAVCAGEPVEVHSWKTLDIQDFAGL
jgi:phosphopantetheinyl transferase